MKANAFTPCPEGGPKTRTAAAAEKAQSRRTTYAAVRLETCLKVHFQLIAFEQLPNTPEVLANLTAQIERYKEQARASEDPAVQVEANAPDASWK